MVGIDEESKRIRTAMLSCGGNASIIKPWIKKLDKIKKNSVSVASKYYKLRDDLTRTLDELEELEDLMIGYKELTPGEKKRFLEIMKDFKSLKGKADNDFLISKADTDFHTTLESILALGPKYVDNNENGIILHSEIENMIEVTKEGLDREKPDMFALTYYYMDHTDADLAELTFADKVIEINRVFNQDFVSQIEEQMEFCVKQVEAIMDRYDGTASRKSEKLLIEIMPLYIDDMDKRSPEQNAKEVLKRICSV